MEFFSGPLPRCVICFDQFHCHALHFTLTLFEPESGWSLFIQKKCSVQICWQMQLLGSKSCTSFAWAGVAYPLKEWFLPLQKHCHFVVKHNNCVMKDRNTSQWARPRSEVEYVQHRLPGRILVDVLFRLSLKFFPLNLCLARSFISH